MFEKKANIETNAYSGLDIFSYLWDQIWVFHMKNETNFSHNLIQPYRNVNQSWYA